MAYPSPGLSSHGDSESASSKFKGYVDKIPTPGATRSTSKFVFVKHSNCSSNVVAPTEITSGYTAGYAYSSLRGLQSPPLLILPSFPATTNY